LVKTGVEVGAKDKRKTRNLRYFKSIGGGKKEVAQKKEREERLQPSPNRWRNGDDNGRKGICGGRDS